MCNVAGLGDAMLIKDITAEHYDRLMDVNLRGVLHGIKHGARAMVKAGNGGSIINWSSIGGLNASLMVGIYSATKAGVISLTKTAALECAGKGIRVNAVCPGYVKTEGMGALLDQVPDAAGKTPLKRLGEPEDIALAALWLASPAGSWVTGKVVEVDGGLAAPNLAMGLPDL